MRTLNLTRSKFHKLLVLLTVFCAFISASAFAQNPNDENSLLWKVEGNGLTKPSFIFGTVHMICQDQFVMSDKVKNALANTEQSYLEINLAAPDITLQSQKYMFTDKSLSNEISKEDYQYLDSLVKTKLKTDLVKFDKVKPMIIMAMLLQASFTCKVVSFESEIIKLTKAANKTVNGLSTVEEQYSFMDKIFDAKDLGKYLKEINDTEINKLLKQLHEAYLKEDVKTMDDLLMGMNTTNPEAYKQLLPVRNHLWADRIPAIIKEKPTMFAIGTGHLLGTEGVVYLLREKGYTVTPIH
nr:TraB/GumN family protein [Pedobacter sp. ASV2]